MPAAIVLERLLLAVGNLLGRYELMILPSGAMALFGLYGIAAIGDHTDCAPLVLRCGRLGLLASKD